MPSHVRFRDSGYLNALFETMPHGVIVGDARGKVLGANSEALRLMGQSPGGLEAKEWHGPEWGLFHPDGSPMAPEEHPGLRALEMGCPVRAVEMGMGPAGGATRWMSVTAAPLAGERVVITCSDLSEFYPGGIPETRRMEQVLRETEKRFARVFQLVPVAVVVTDMATGRLLAVNHAFHRMYGYEEGEVQGRTTGDLAIWADGEDRARVIDLLRRGESVRDFEALGRRKDGSKFWVAFSIDHVELDGKQCLLGAGVDITERRCADEERRALEARTLRAERMQSLGNLAGGIAHDMNNVLGAILGLACVTRQDVAQGRLQESLDAIVRACLLGRDTVRILLDFSRHHLGEEGLVDLNALVTEVMGLLEHTILQRVRLDLALLPRLPPILGDVSALSHALMNLCVNAVDSMPQGGTLRVRTRDLGDGHVSLEVLDTGCGMEADVLDRALEPYFTTKPQGKGTGLGLPQVYGTVKAHGAEMDIDSAPGRGTRVVLRFPVHHGNHGPLRATEPEAIRAGRPMRVLLVDDDEILRFALRIQLAHLGHTVIVVSETGEALESLDRGLEVDVVVLDVNVPVLGGGCALPALREARCGLPVLVISSQADAQADAAVAPHAPVIVLGKPFTLAELEERLAVLVP